MDKWQELRKYLLAEQKRTAEEERTYMAHPAVSSSMLMQKRTIERHLAFMADLERKEKRERKMKSHDKTIQSKNGSGTGQK